MNIQQRIRKVSLSGWIKAACWSAIYIVFVVWVAWGDWASLGWLAILPLIIDMTVKIKVDFLIPNFKIYCSAL